MLLIWPVFVENLFQLHRSHLYLTTESFCHYSHYLQYYLNLFLAPANNMYFSCIIVHNFCIAAITHKTDYSNLQDKCSVILENIL